MFTVELERANGERFELQYDHRTNQLTTMVGDEVVVLGDRKAVPEMAPTFSPTNPLVGKKRHINALKVQLGLKCNYSCSYCSQATHIGEGVISNIDDAVFFLDHLDDWLLGSPSSIDLWGGEPLVYWKMLRYLIPKLRERFPDAELGFFTNGSLLTDEKVDFIKHYKVDITLSHDGPGQHLRGDDPLDDEEVLRCVRRLIDECPDQFDVNSVISIYTADVNAAITWFQDKVHPEIDVNFEGIVDSHGDAGMGLAGSFDTETYQVMVDAIKRNVHDPDIADGGFARYTKQFIEKIFLSVPADMNGQKCGMDRQDTAAVDLQGNVMTCHNTGAEGEHNLGSVFDMDNVSLDTSWHWSERPDCEGCPYLQICRGSCMYVTGDNWVETCENNYQFSRAIFEAAIERLVDAKVIRLNGYHSRPKKRGQVKIDIVNLS